MHIVCLDLEGVLVPEMWMAVSRELGIPALARTTRDEADYDTLMSSRLRLLSEHRVTISEILWIIAELEPLEGALPFLQKLRSAYQVVILSDTFSDLARPLMGKLGWPTLMCHELEVDEVGAITDYRLRQPDAKAAAVGALKALNYRVIAAGDSYNDLSMLRAADAGFWFRPPSRVIREHPEIPVVNEYPELLIQIAAAADRTTDPGFVSKSNPVKTPKSCPVVSSGIKP